MNHRNSNNSPSVLTRGSDGEEERIILAGIDLATVKGLLVYKTIAMTMRYAHLAPSHRVKVVDVLDRVMNEKSASQLLHNLG